MSFRMIGDRSNPGWADSDPGPDLVAELAYVALADRDYRAQWVMDALPGYELAFVRDGSLLLWLEDDCLRAGPGDIFVVPPRTLHREETPPDAFSEVIYLGAVLRSEAGRERLFPLPIAPLLHLGRGHAVEQRLLQIVAEVQAGEPGFSRIVAGAVREIFYHLARATAGTASAPASRPDGLAFPGFGREAQEYLARHHAEPVSIDDVARHFHLSRQYFTKLFRRLVGQSPHAYLTDVRLQHAKTLLDGTALPIQELSARVGFADAYYFSRTFRQHTGLTPTQYRNRSKSPTP